MDATHNMFCHQDDLINPLASMGMQVACILVISHFFNIVLRTLGQPGPIAQILVINYAYLLKHSILIWIFYLGSSGVALTLLKKKSTLKELYIFVI